MSNKDIPTERKTPLIIVAKSPTNVKLDIGTPMLFRKLITIVGQYTIKSIPSIKYGKLSFVALLFSEKC